MRDVVVWIREGTWQACVDAAGDLDADVVLLHVIDSGSAEALSGPLSGLLGRGLPKDVSSGPVLKAAQDALLDAAEARLGRPARRRRLAGHVEREVVAACADADLLICARDADRTRLGPKSLGRATRFVVDHAPCQVLLIWPGEPPALATLPPPPGHHRPPAAT